MVRPMATRETRPWHAHDVRRLTGYIKMNKTPLEVSRLLKRPKRDIDEKLAAIARSKARRQARSGAPVDRPHG